jgi:cyclopropane fatty-acyl-phospholipid synthase-like methyltransferase
MANWQAFSLYSDPMMAYLENETRKVREQHEPPFSADEFAHFDALHYAGYRYLDPFFDTLPAQPQVLDIGSGIGGPARHVAQKFNASVTAIDPLDRYNQLHQTINQLCRLEDHIHVAQTDATADDLTTLPGAGEGFDAIYAMLSFLHVADKTALLNNCQRLLKPGGQLYIEDWAIQDTTPFTPEEAEAQQRVGMTSCLTQEDYEAYLKQAGFSVQDFRFRSQEWSRFVWDRGNALLAKKTPLKEEYGEKWWQLWSSWGAQYALYAFHDLQLSMPAIRDQFPNVVASLGDQQVEAWTQGSIAQKYGGAYILATA